MLKKINNMLIRALLFLSIPALMSGEGLKSLIEYASKNNELVVSKNLSNLSKEQEVKSSKNSYYPTLDIGAFYQRYDEASPIMPGTTYSGYAKVSLDIYSGGKKSYTLKQKKEEHLASAYEYESIKKNTQLAIVQNFYAIKNLQATLKAYQDSAVAVQAQLDRMKKFLDAKLATSDDVDRLQSAYDKNIYSIESIKFEIISLKKALEIKVGKKIDTLDSSEFVKTDISDADELDYIKALRATKNSIVNASEVVDSYYYPQIKLEDTYSIYGYADEPTAFPIEQLDNQNKLMLTLNMRVFDFGVLSQAKRSIELNAQAVDKQISYQSKEQKMNQELALYRIQTAKLNIKSSQSALKAASSALETITQKYNSGIVDNVVYLDALSSQTEAKALYESSLNNLEVAYALYYFYNAKKLEEFLND